MSLLINGSCSRDQCYSFCVLCLCAWRDITLFHKHCSDVGTETFLGFLSHSEPLWTTAAAWCHITQYVIPGMAALSPLKARVRDGGLFVKSADLMSRAQLSQRWLSACKTRSFTALTRPLSQNNSRCCCSSSVTRRWNFRSAWRCGTTCRTAVCFPCKREDGRGAGGQDQSFKSVSYGILIHLLFSGSIFRWHSVIQPSARRSLHCWEGVCYWLSAAFQGPFL